jgi:hypothetical protein
MKYSTVFVVERAEFAQFMKMEMPRDCLCIPRERLELGDARGFTAHQAIIVSMQPLHPKGMAILKHMLDDPANVVYASEWSR